MTLEIYDFVSGTYARERSESQADAFASGMYPIKRVKVNINIMYADMAELADAYGSGPYESNFMQVQVLLSAPYRVFITCMKL